MILETKILTLKPREESGPKTSRKYLFQKNLSLYLLLNEHSKRNNYLFLFDFHEDLILSDSETSLSNLECFQIKSKDTKGNWTIKTLTDAPKEKNSILGKLYYNKIVFEDAIKSLNFISNGKYGFEKLKDGSDSTLMTSILASELSKNDLDACNKSIISEYSLSKSDFEKLGQFRVTTLSNLDSSTHCIGALAALINSINPSNKINAQLAYEQVFREVTRKTDATTGDKSFSEISELFELKGISKAQFLEFLKKAGLYKSVEDEWGEIKASLESEGINYLTLMDYKNAWRDMSARLIADSGSIPLTNLKNKILDSLESEKSTINEFNLTKIIDYIFERIDSSEYNDYFVKCLIIKMLNES